ncbi:hypothetical protein FQR65_LT00564 [Abscondita terminalis]|nr:hypothetical protein FQR65_LT00564 [Abscondita terminalis]
MRKASHCGSWYSDSASTLCGQMNKWLEEVDVMHNPARAIIAPHAAYRYSGACAGFAYRQVNPDLISRIFILGPSHHARVSGCALTSLTKYQTPFYDLLVDEQVNKMLMNSGEFEYINVEVDEAEHSIEMQLPYIAKIMENNKNNFTIVPVLVGVLNANEQKIYGKIFADYLNDPVNLFVISSDFCHWGSGFQYTYLDKRFGEIYESIEALDRAGMDIIENLDPSEFTIYLKKFRNTICGRYPIGILLETIQEVMQRDKSNKFNLKFLKYEQSNKCISVNDTSVSYASASLISN